MTVLEWKGRVASLGCLICGMGASLHHVREGQGLGQRAKDWMVIPLCREHHQGNAGWHTLGPSRFWTRYKEDEMTLLAKTIEGVVKQL